CDSDFTRADHFLDPERFEQIDHSLDLALITSHFQHIGLGGHIDDLGPEDLGETEHFSTCIRLGIDLDEHHLTIHVRLFTEIRDFDHINEAIQLLVYLLQDLVIPRSDQRNTRHTRVFRLSHTQALNIETTSTEQPGNAPEDTKLIFHQHRKGVAVYSVMIRRHNR